MDRSICKSLSNIILIFTECNVQSSKALICYKDPDSHPFVSDKEKDHLKKEMGQLERDKIKAVPWRQIFSSPAVIALIFAQVKY